MDLENFRQEARSWLEENCPDGMRNRTLHFEDGPAIYGSEDGQLWQQRMAERGWTAPMWPKQYGGGGLSPDENRVLTEELGRIKALPGTTGMGIFMIGPVLLEYGTEDQKQRHLPPIARGEVIWCQGYSEPGAGSDLAGLQTKAVLQGDHFVINGQKIWTSGADGADWMFALVRTDPDAPKHEGISFVLLDMHQPGVSVKPIPLISGSSPFCETFFDDAIARRDDLIGEMNTGWTVAKRLLQFERSGVDTGSDSANKNQDKKKQKPSLNRFASLAKSYVGETNGKVGDAVLRDQILRHTMQQKALQLTGRRVMETAEAGKAPGAVTSIFKYIGSTQTQNGADLESEIMGVRGAGWEGSEFEAHELEATRNWLRDRAVTIYGGTNEIQLNIISKRILGLPD
jgi:alkylation response protein AidB-like acyl-CoA dehydrogenase